MVTGAAGTEPSRVRGSRVTPKHEASALVRPRLGWTQRQDAALLPGARLSVGAMGEKAHEGTDARAWGRILETVPSGVDGNTGQAVSLNSASENPPSGSCIPFPKRPGPHIRSCSHPLVVPDPPHLPRCPGARLGHLPP